MDWTAHGLDMDWTLIGLEMDWTGLDMDGWMDGRTDGRTDLALRMIELIKLINRGDDT
jgi:hypothetical protein